MTISALLRDARKKKGQSQRAAARELDCSEMAFRMWERGVWVPGAERAKAIARWTGLSKTKVLAMMGILEPHEAKAVREKAPAYQAKIRQEQADRKAAAADLILTAAPMSVPDPEELRIEREHARSPRA